MFQVDDIQNQELHFKPISVPGVNAKDVFPQKARTRSVLLVTFIFSAPNINAFQRGVLCEGGLALAYLESCTR